MNFTDFPTNLGEWTFLVWFDGHFIIQSGRWDWFFNYSWLLRYRRCFWTAILGKYLFESLLTFDINAGLDWTASLSNFFFLSKQFSYWDLVMYSTWVLRSELTVRLLANERVFAVVVTFLVLLKRRLLRLRTGWFLVTAPCKDLYNNL